VGKLFELAVLSVRGVKTEAVGRSLALDTGVVRVWPVPGLMRGS